jgi:hypothetical protein
MDSLALQSSSGSTPNFTTLIELSFLDFHSDLAFPASATPVTSAAAWEGKYRSQIPPHACASHLVFGGRISGTFSWTSNTVLPPRVVFTVAIYVHPDAAVPIPTLAFFLPDLITDTSGRPLNNAWLFTFADTEAGSMSINNIDDWFTVGVDVPAGAQSEVYVSIAASAAAAGGSVQCSGRVFLHWPDPNALFATPPKWVQLA